MASFLGNEEGAFRPQEGWRLLHEGDDQAIVVNAGPGGEGGISLITLLRVDGQWQLGGAQSGQCQLRAALPAGLNTVEWRFDPDIPAPTPNSTALDLLITEQECVGGQAIGDRLMDLHARDRAQLGVIALCTGLTRVEDL